MTFQEFEDYVQALFIAGWTGESCTIAYPNQIFDRPEPGVGTKYGAMSILPVFGEQISICPVGQRRYRNNGLILIDFLVPQGDAGTSELNRLCQKALGIFTNMVPNVEARFNSPYISRSGAQDDGWFSQSCVVEYSYDEIK